MGSNKIFITETPPVGFPIKYGVDNKITFTLDADLFGYDLRFVVYKEIGSPKILEILRGTKLDYITFTEDARIKTRIFLTIDKTDSKLIPIVRTPSLVLDCKLAPTCFWDLFGIISGEIVPVLDGFIQGTPTAEGAI
jgi:hypothetical protein